MGDDAFSREAQGALLRALARTADARRVHGRYSEAERLYQRALSVAQDVFGERHQEVATILNNLGLVMEAEGRNSEAEPLYYRAWRLREELLGRDHPDTAAASTNLAVLRKRLAAQNCI